MDGSLAARTGHKSISVFSLFAIIVKWARGHCHIEQVEAFFDGGEMMLRH